MLWSWPQEGPPLSSHESAVGAVLAYLSTRFALPPLFCDIAKFIGVEKLVAGPCRIASLVPPVVEVIEEITVHVASRTTLSTITLGPNTLPEYVAPPDFMDLLIPYSLLFVWAFGLIYILVFSGSTGILAPPKPTIRVQEETRREWQASLPRLHADDSDHSDNSDMLSSPTATASSTFVFPNPWYAVPLIFDLCYIIFGAPLLSNFVAQLLVNLFDLATTLCVNSCNFFDSVGRDVITLCVDIGQQLSTSTPLGIVARNCLFGLGCLFYKLTPVWLPCLVVLLLAAHFCPRALYSYVELWLPKNRRPSGGPGLVHVWCIVEEPTMDDSAFPPDDLYAETHTCAVRMVVQKYCDDRYIDQEISSQQKYYKVNKQRHGHHSKFTEAVEDPVDESRTNIPGRTSTRKRTEETRSCNDGHRTHTKKKSVSFEEFSDD